MPAKAISLDAISEVTSLVATVSTTWNENQSQYLFSKWDAGSCPTWKLSDTDVVWQNPTDIRNCWTLSLSNTYRVELRPLKMPTSRTLYVWKNYEDNLKPQGNGINP